MRRSNLLLVTILGPLALVAFLAFAPRKDDPPGLPDESDPNVATSGESRSFAPGRNSGASHDPEALPSCEVRTADALGLGQSEQHAGLADPVGRFFRELERVQRISDEKERARRLADLVRRAQVPPALEASVLALASLDPQTAFEILLPIVRAGPSSNFEEAFELASRLHPSLAMTVCAEILNSDYPAATKVAIASAMVGLVRLAPVLETPTISTLHYAQETNSEPIVLEALNTQEERIRDEAAERARQASGLPRVETPGEGRGRGE